MAQGPLSSVWGQQFGWDFVTAKVAYPHLCVDFLCAYELLVDVKHQRLIDADTFCSYTCTLSGAGSIRLSSTLSATDDFLRLLANSSLHPTFSSSAAKHGVEHHIASLLPGSLPRLGQAHRHQGWPPYIFLGTASPETGCFHSHWRWTPWQLSRARLLSSPCRSYSAWWTSITALSP